MATRHIFIPYLNGPPYVRFFEVEFKWHYNNLPRTITLMHKAAKQTTKILEMLEVSGASELQIGRELSAFNLSIKTPSGEKISVESAYQGSKVFSDKSTNHDLYFLSSKDAKRQSRTRMKGKLIGFNLFGVNFPTEPKTSFYDWLYINALLQKQDNFLESIKHFQAFTDIFANPDKTLNCQARSLALFISLSKNNLLIKSNLMDKGTFDVFSPFAQS